MNKPDLKYYNLYTLDGRYIATGTRTTLGTKYMNDKGYFTPSRIANRKNHKYYLIEAVDYKSKKKKQSIKDWQLTSLNVHGNTIMAVGQKENIIKEELAELGMKVKIYTSPYGTKIIERIK